MTPALVYEPCQCAPAAGYPAPKLDVGGTGAMSGPRARIEAVEAFVLVGDKD